jgi:hypothetical protein
MTRFIPKGFDKMITRRSLGLSVLFCFLALSAGDACAEKPIPCGKDAYTNADLQKEMHEYLTYQASLYEKCTQDPPEIRSDAKAFSDAVFKRATGNLQEPSWEELSKQGNALVARGEADPHILAEMGFVEDQREKPAEAVAFFKQAVEKFASSKYPASRKCRAYNMLRSVLEEMRAPADQWEPFKGDFRKLILESLTETLEEPKFRRAAWIDVQAFYRADNNARNQTMLPATLAKDLEKSEKIDPWMKNMLLGRYYIAKAWQARGSGMANTVTEKGWKGFRENLAKSAECFTKAWEIDPKLPYAAAAMIEVAMGGGDQEHSTRDWFDRAVEAQMDYKDAYDKYLWSIRPRWGGSHIQMYRFGLECLATKRFDTPVPEILINILLDIEGEIGEKGEIWQEEGVFDNIKTLMEGIENEPSRRANSNPLLKKLEITLSACFLISLEVREYDEARKILDKLGDKLQLEAFSRFRRSYPYDISRVYALTGAAGTTLKEFDDMIADGGYSDPDTRKSAQELLDEAVKKDTDAKAKDYFDHWKSVFLALDRFEKGEWIDFSFDDKLAGWEAIRGDWKPADPKTIVGAPKKGSEELGLKCSIPFQAPYEIECDVEFPAPATSGSAGVMLGCLWTIRPDDYLAILGVDTANKDLCLSLPNQQPKRKHIELKDQTKFRIQVKFWNPQFEYSIEGQSHPIQLLPKEIRSDTFVLASTAKEVRFSNVRIRKLADEPPAKKEAEKE